MVSEVAEDPTLGRPCTVDARRWRERTRGSIRGKSILLVVKA
jgi:hypothetical protein